MIGSDVNITGIARSRWSDQTEILERKGLTLQQLLIIFSR